MRFYKLACAFGLLVAIIGCASEKWAWNKNKSNDSELDSKLFDKSTEAKYRGWVSPAGSEDRSREIEKRLGVY